MPACRLRAIWRAAGAMEEVARCFGSTKAASDILIGQRIERKNGSGFVVWRPTALAACFGKDEMDSVNEAPKIGPVIQAERKKRHLTLDRLAALSGVSRSMLSQIERGEANPTFAVLWSLTQALGIDFSQLLAGGAPQQRKPDGIDLVTLALTPEIRSPDGAWRLRILSPPSLAGQVEWYEVEIAPGSMLQSAPHAPGTFEHLTACSEGLLVETGHGSQKLATGETARYRADVAHEIRNTGRQTARALMVVLHELRA